jgi:hypothetical protein
VKGNNVSEEEAQKRVDEGNQQIEADIRHCNEVGSYGPRRSHHWEVRGGEACLVED